ncbi:MAG: hypothetical protein MZU79_00965 [Anaerotruncus sp.]|nr:hypothetical protein [Anaerotruncus sp.]
MPLQILIDKQGDSALIRFEEEADFKDLIRWEDLLSPLEVVWLYSEKAMQHLKRMSKIVFLDVPFRSIVKRIPNARKRGIVGLKDRSLKELFEERTVLYRNYADFSVKLKDKDNIQRLVEKIIKLCSEEESGFSRC